MTPSSSEIETHGKLDNTRVQRSARDLAERRSLQCSARVRKLRVIEGVEKVRAELHIRGFIGTPGDEVFAKRHIPVRLVRPAHNTNTQVPKPSSNGAGVKKSRGAPTGGIRFPAGKRTYPPGGQAGRVEKTVSFRFKPNSGYQLSP